MERYGTPRTKKFFEGMELSYLLKGHEEWDRGAITQLIVDDKSSF